MDTFYITTLVGIIASVFFGGIAIRTVFLSQKRLALQVKDHEESKRNEALAIQAKESAEERLNEVQKKIADMQLSVIESQRNEAAAREGIQNANLQIEELTKKLNELEKSSSENHVAKVKAEAEAQKARELLDKERELLSEAEKNFNDAFKSLASTALEGNNKQFLDLAKQFFKGQTESAKGDLKQRQQAIEGLIKPFKETMDKYQERLRELEMARQKSYNDIERELKQVIDTGTTLSAETRALKDALKKPHVRGRWGEIQLKNCVELAGMSEYADVTFQDFNETDEGQRLIPDMTVKMPGGRVVVVDSKAPLDAFLAALEATSEEQRMTETARHGRQVKDHIKKLSGKAYQENLPGSADFTVMFLPNESFLYAALEVEPDLVEYAMQMKILVATPPTFVGLLKVIRYGWNEDKLARNALEISDAGKELHKRIVDFVESFQNIGKHLKRAKDEYEVGFARLNSRVLVQARRMEDLGVKGKKELPEGLGHESLVEATGTDGDADVIALPLEGEDGGRKMGEGGEE